MDKNDNIVSNCMKIRKQVPTCLVRKLEKWKFCTFFYDQSCGILIFFEFPLLDCICAQSGGEKGKLCSI